MFNQKLMALFASLFLLSLSAFPIVAQATTEEASIKEVKHELGTTSIKGIPQRIVVLEYSFADNLGSLGVAPVGFALDAMPDYLLPYTKEVGAEVVGTRKTPSLEKIASLKPDFIIADLRRHKKIYEQLSAIAPTAVFNSLRGSYQDQLDTFIKIAQVLNKEGEARVLLNDYQDRFDGIAAMTNPNAGKFVIGVLWANGFTAHSNQSFMGSFLESLGRKNALVPQREETQCDKVQVFVFDFFHQNRTIGVWINDRAFRGQGFLFLINVDIGFAIEPPLKRCFCQANPAFIVLDV